MEEPSSEAVRRRLAEMDERLRAAQAELQAELGVARPASPSLVDRLRELSSGCEIALGPASPTALTLAAGPFGDLAALDAFGRAVAALPEVETACVRGYAGHDRAVLELRLREAPR